jgi:hypothetical protein
MGLNPHPVKVVLRLVSNHLPPGAGPGGRGLRLGSTQGDSPMLRTFGCAVLALVVAVGILVAAEYKGKVKNLDADKNTITVTVGDKDVDITFNDDTKIVSYEGKAVKDRAKTIQGIAKKPEAVEEVTVTTEKKDGKEVATEIKVKRGKKKQ